MFAGSMMKSKSRPAGTPRPERTDRGMAALEDSLLQAPRKDSSGSEVGKKGSGTPKGWDANRPSVEAKEKAMESAAGPSIPGHSAQSDEMPVAHRGPGGSIELQEYKPMLARPIDADGRSHRSERSGVSSRDRASQKSAKQDDLDDDEELIANATNIRDKILLFFEVPQSSIWATIWGVLMVFVIVWSVIFTLIDTNGSPKVNHTFMSTNEIVVTMIFTFEYVSRLILTRRRLPFFFNFMNTIDILAILPWYAQTLEVAIAGDGSNTSKIGALRILRLMRVFRILKLSKQFEIMQLMTLSVRRSFKALCVMAFHVVVSMVIFGSAILYAERGPYDAEKGFYVDNSGNGNECMFQDLLDTFWWALVTMTTVGYGDVYPITPGGRLVGAGGMVVGVLVFSVAMSIIGNNYSAVWEEMEERSDRKALKKKLSALHEDGGNLFERVSDIKSSSEYLEDDLLFFRALIVHLDGRDTHLKYFDTCFDDMRYNLKKMVTCIETLTTSEELAANLEAFRNNDQN